MEEYLIWVADNLWEFVCEKVGLIICLEEFFPAVHTVKISIIFWVCHSLKIYFHICHKYCHITFLQGPDILLYIYIKANMQMHIYHEVITIYTHILYLQHVPQYILLIYQSGRSLQNSAQKQGQKNKDQGYCLIRLL